MPPAVLDIEGLSTTKRRTLVNTCGRIRFFGYPSMWDHGRWEGRTMSRQISDKQQKDSGKLLG